MGLEGLVLLPVDTQIWRPGVAVFDFVSKLQQSLRLNCLQKFSNNLLVRCTYKQPPLTPGLP